LLSVGCCGEIPIKIRYAPKVWRYSALAETLEKELNKARKHSALLQSKLDGAFTQYHNEVQDMQEKSDELVRKNKSLRQKTKVC
jgi:FtsZ-binding cell division protein ZapB